MIKPIITALLALLLGACDQISQKLGLEDPAQKEARMEPEAKAVGGACRHSGRAIEDCYSIYGWLPKAGIFTGWREMDEYMRQNELETIAPLLPPPEGPGNRKKKKPAVEEAVADEAPGSKEKTPEKSPEKPAEKH